MKMRPCKDNRMNHDEAEELGSEDGDPDRPEEIGNQPSPPRVEYLQYATSTDQRTQGGGGCSKLDASLERRPPQTATTLLQRYVADIESEEPLTSVTRTPAHTNERTANAASMARIQKAKSRLSVLGGMTGLSQLSRTPVS